MTPDLSKLVRITYDFPLIKMNPSSVPSLPRQLTLPGIDIISTKSFKELFENAQSKHLPYYLFVAVPKKSNYNPKSTSHASKTPNFLILDGSYFQKRSFDSKCKYKNVHYFALDCFKYFEEGLITNDFISLTDCRYLHSSSNKKINSYLHLLDKTDEKTEELLKINININIILALISPVLRENELNSIYTLIFSVGFRLNNYSEEINQTHSKMTPEFLLSQSGYKNYDELPPMAENFVEEKKEKYFRFKKSLGQETAKWVIAANQIF